MSYTERFPRRHPLCTCPDWAPDFKGTPPPDRAACTGGRIAHPPPIDPAELAGLLDRIENALYQPRADS